MLTLSVWAAITKRHKLGILQATEIYWSLFWKLEVQDQLGEEPLPGCKLFIPSSHG